MKSFSDDESYTGVGRRIKQSAQDRMKKIRFFQNSNENVGIKDRQMNEMKANLDRLNAEFSSFQATSAAPQATNTHNYHHSNTQQFGAINRNFRVNALDVPVKSRNVRDLSPTGMSTNHAKELLNTLGEFVKVNQNLDERSSETYLDNTATYLKKIFKAQRDEDSYNAPHMRAHNSTSFEPEFLRTKPNTYNANKVAEKSRIIHRQLVSIETSGLKSFLANIELCDVSDFTPCEYNMLVHMSITKDIKEKLESTGGNPLNMSTSEYLERLNKQLNGNISSAYDFDVKFATFSPQQKSIMGVYQEYRKFMENIPSQIIGDDEKNRKIIISMMKLIPYSLHPFLNSIQQSQNGRMTLTSFENFLKVHEVSIDRFLQERKGRTFVKKIHANEDFNTLDSSSCSDFSDYNQHNLESETDMIEQFEGVFKIGQTQSNFKFSKCSTCFRYGHKNADCIFAENNEKRLFNQNKMGIKHCLLCRSRSHRDTECTEFEGLKPVPAPCKNCQDAGYYQFHHLTANCVRLHFLEKKKKEELNN